MKKFRIFIFITLITIPILPVIYSVKTGGILKSSEESFEVFHSSVLSGRSFKTPRQKKSIQISGSPVLTATGFYPQNYTVYTDSDANLQKASRYIRENQPQKVESVLKKDSTSFHHDFLRILGNFLSGSYDELILKNYSIRKKYPLLKEYLLYLGCKASFKKGQKETMTLLDILEKTIFKKQAVFMKMKILKEKDPAKFIKYSEKYLSGIKKFTGDDYHLAMELAEVLKKKGDKKKALSYLYLVWSQNNKLEKSASKNIFQLTGKNPLRNSSCKTRIKYLEKMNKNMSFDKIIRDIKINGIRCSQSEKCAYYYYIGRAHYYRKNRTESLNSLKKAVYFCNHKTAPRDLIIKSLYLAGKSSLATGKKSTALKFLRRIHQQFPGHRYADDALYIEISILKSMNFKSRAKKLLNLVEKNYPSGDKTFNALFNRALSMGRNKSFDSAIALLEKIRNSTSSVVNTEQTGKILYWLGKFNELKGDLKKAQLYYQKTAILSPGSFYSLYALNRMNFKIPDSGNRLLEKLISDKTPTTVPWSILKSKHFNEKEFPVFLELSRYGLVEIALRVLQQKFSIFSKNHGTDKSFLRAVSFILLKNSMFYESFLISGKVLEDHTLMWGAGKNQLIWKMSFPELYSKKILQWSIKHKIPWYILSGLVREESAFNPGAISSANARGLTQIMPATAKYIARKTGISYSSAKMLEKPDVSLNMTAWYLARLSKLFKGNTPFIIAAYNAGEGKIKRFLGKNKNYSTDMQIEMMDYEETRKYIRRVTASAFAYKLLYGDKKLLKLPVD
ncbi:MAG: transglycosylase SLT domain-containing protein [Deltaproteobacteria bacterium]|nr:transglycosylase SLT domain-containing protein [Deltaproteobacteria bacterium]